MADIIIKDHEHLLGGGGFTSAEITLTFSESTTGAYSSVSYYDDDHVFAGDPGEISGLTATVDTIVNSIVWLDITSPASEFDIENCVGCEPVEGEDGYILITDSTASCTITYK